MEGIYFKDLKQTLKKEQCDVSLWDGLLLFSIFSLFLSDCFLFLVFSLLFFSFLVDL